MAKAIKCDYCGICYTKTDGVRGVIKIKSTVLPKNNNLTTRKDVCPICLQKIANALSSKGGMISNETYDTRLCYLVLYFLRRTNLAEYCVCHGV